MTTELVHHDTSAELSTQMEYSRAIAQSDLLPVAYRGKPANVLLAVGLGASMGLSPAESLSRIHVIQGQPTASAELIASNVRRAGHKLRVRGDEQSCTATIVRADDPEFDFTVTRDMAWAKNMGLTGKDNWKKQPGTMLQWRAISAVARLACPEALYGVSYTMDEITESRTVRSTTVTPAFSEPPADARAETEQDEQPSESPDSPPISDKTRKHLFALFTQKGIPDDQQLAGINYRLGTQYTSRKQLTEDDGQALITYLDSLPDAANDNVEDAEEVTE